MAGMVGKRAAVYVRISDDREGERLGVERQRADCIALAERKGYVVIRPVYEDNDIGASTRSAPKRRPDYDAMLSAARAGEVEAIVSYTSGRLTRRPRETEDLIELAERQGVRFDYVASPSFDLNTAAGRRIARILAANDAGEAEDIAERVSRAARGRAEKGEFHGGPVAFGYSPIIGPTGERLAWEHHPEHADWVREGARRLLAEESLYSVCMDWHRQGRRTATGNVWRPRTLKRALISPSVAGLRALDGGYVPASKWTAILDRDTWERVRDLLTDESRLSRPFPAGGSARKYPLSGLVRCGRCGQAMNSSTASKGGPAAFVCTTLVTGGCGKMRISMEPLERYVVAYVAYLLDSREWRAAMAATSDDDEAEQALRGAVVTDERRLERLADEHDDDLIPDSEYRRRRKRLEGRIAENRQALGKLARRRAMTDLPSGSDFLDLWERWDNPTRRTFVSRVIDRVEVAPFPPGMTTNLSRRRGESDRDLRSRRDRHEATVLERRVTVHRTTAIDKEV